MAKTKTPIILVALAFLVEVVSALPVSRPWEYFNETMGRARDAWFYFDDEDIDMSQRGKELARYGQCRSGSSCTATSFRPGNTR